MADSFGSRIVGVALGFGVLDPTESAELIDGMLADLETAKDGVNGDQWLARQPRRARIGKFDGLWVAVGETDVESFWLSIMVFGLKDDKA